MKKGNYNYLLRLYVRVDEFLANSAAHGDLPEIVTSFCTFVEKILKIKLYDKNPILVFDHLRIKDDDRLVAIIKRIELNIETIKIDGLINRYKLVFRNKFSEEELQVVRDVYQIRNHFIHSYKADDPFLANKEDIIKKMGTVWEKISDLAISTFGKEQIKASKPKTKYTKAELESVLREQVKKKINRLRDSDVRSHFSITAPITHSTSTFGMISEQCPRCGAWDFFGQDSTTRLVNFSISPAYNPIPFPDLYVCSVCNLELTEKEYEIAKQLNANI